MHPPRPTAWLLLSSLALLATPQDPPRPGGRQPVEPPATEVRLVDDATGAPIAGGRVSAVLEATCPLSGTWWSARSATSDDEGRARLRLDDLAGDPWLFFEAEGYAPRAELTRSPDPVVELVRGVDQPLQVRDALERPVAGALVGLMLGCGHAPDVRWVRTDASGSGVLRGIEPGVGDLWVVGPGLLADYGDGDLEEGTLVVRCAPGIEASGRLVDPEGRPLAGAWVGQPRRHRGPWTQADEQGRFRLVGAEWPVWLHVRDAQDPEQLLGLYELPSDGREVTLTVPAREEATVTLAVALDDADAGEAPHAIQVEAVRRSDDLTLRAHVHRGEAALALPRGDYELSAGGGLSGWRRLARSLAVGDEDASVELTLRRAPRVTLVAPWLGEEGRVVLVGTGEERDVSAAVREGEPVGLPPGGLCGLRLRSQGRARAIELHAEQRVDGARLELERP